MLPQNKPDRIRILFDDHRLVANAGLFRPRTFDSTWTLGAKPRRSTLYADDSEIVK